LSHLGGAASAANGNIDALLSPPGVAGRHVGRHHRS